MSAATGSDGLPSLLVQAARTAAEEDGLAPSAEKAPASVNNTADDNVAAAALTSIGSGQSPDKKKNDDVVAAMDRARSEVAAATTAPPAVATKTPSAGTAAHIMASQAPPPPVRKAPSAPAQSSSSPMPTPSHSKKKGPPLRRGKWTPEEEAYANRLIMEFKSGLLPLTDGTTLRTFLSKLLNCDPMRISKKFVGSNCIGKQVFRRRTADINRLTPEQIQQSRAELSELERRFLERVAQTNRVKSSGVGGGGGGGSSNVGANAMDGKLKDDLGEHPPSPPWLQPPLGYKQGTGAAMAAAALAGGGANSRAAAAGRALLQGVGGLDSGKSKSGLRSHGSAGLLAMAELQRRSQQNLLQNAIGNRASANNLLAAAVASGGAGGSGLSSSAMAQIARNASAARLAGLTAAGNSVNNLMLKTGLSRDQLTQLAREQGMAPSASLSNMMERQSSFDALMSLDFQSLQSIDNLANLIQTGGGLPAQIPEAGMKNWSADGGQGSGAAGSSGNLSGLASMRRLASAGRMESLLRSLSSGNVNKSASASSVGAGAGGSSNANFNNLLQSVQSNLGGAGGSANNLFGANAASALSLANMFRPDSSTGLTALRMQDGLVQRNSSVDDFLSLVASGDIPHQDPTLLNVPLLQQQQQQAAAGGQSGAQAAATYLAQQQLLAQAANSGNAALQNALARGGSLGSLRNTSGTSLGQHGASTAAALQHRAAALGLTSATGLGGGGSAKRKLVDLDGDLDDHGSRKR